MSRAEPVAEARRRPLSAEERSEAQAFRELMEILREPFISKCDKCHGTGVTVGGLCKICDGEGQIRIDFI